MENAVEIELMMRRKFKQFLMDLMLVLFGFAVYYVVNNYHTFQVVFIEYSENRIKVFLEF